MQAYLGLASNVSPVPPQSLFSVIQWMAKPCKIHQPTCWDKWIPEYVCRMNDHTLSKMLCTLSWTINNLLLKLLKYWSIYILCFSTKTILKNKTSYFEYRLNFKWKCGIYFLTFRNCGKHCKKSFILTAI